MIFIKPSRSANFVDSRKTKEAAVRLIKPQAVLDYSKEKQGTDLSEQLSTYYTWLHRSNRCYQKVAFEMIFEYH